MVPGEKGSQVQSGQVKPTGPEQGQRTVLGQGPVQSQPPPPAPQSSCRPGPALGTALRAATFLPFSQGSPSLRLEDAGESQGPYHPLKRPPFPYAVCGPSSGGKTPCPLVMKGAPFSPLQTLGSTTHGQGSWGGSGPTSTTQYNTLKL